MMMRTDDNVDEDEFLPITDEEVNTFSENIQAFAMHLELDDASDTSSVAGN